MISTNIPTFSPASPRNAAPGKLKLSIANCRIGYYRTSMTTFSLKLDEKLAASLAAEARMRRTTRSELCRRAIAGLLRQSGKSKPTLFQQTQDLSGAGSSGLRDLSSNPRHLVGFGQKAR